MLIDSPEMAEYGWWAFLTLSGHQANNLSADDHIQFDELRTSGTFNTYDEAGDPLTWDGDEADTDNQDVGIIALPANKTFRIRAHIRNNGSGATMTLTYQIYNLTDPTLEGVAGVNRPPSSTNNNSISEPAEAVITTTEETKLELRILSSTVTTSISSASRMIIEQIRDED